MKDSGIDEGGNGGGRGGGEQAVAIIANRFGLRVCADIPGVYLLAIDRVIHFRRSITIWYIQYKRAVLASLSTALTAL